MDTLTWIQNWFYENCDGDWEHGFGVRIETLDNPGWSVEIELVGTPLETMPFQDANVERTETDWLHCTVRDGHFKGAGGPMNLQQILEIFRKWASRVGATSD